LEYRRDYYRKHLDEMRAKNRNWARTHKDVGARYHLEHRDQILESKRVDYRNDPAKFKLRNARIHHALLERTKLDVMSHYSGSSQPQCANPYGQHEGSYADIRALSIDHVNGGGTKHRKALGSGGGLAFYGWLIKNAYPPGYQVLCMNCQFIKRHESKEG